MGLSKDAAPGPFRMASVRPVQVPGGSSEAARPDEPRRTNGMDLHVGTRIRLRRTTLGLSQQRLASALGVSLPMVHRYERGVSRISAADLFALSRLLGVLYRPRLLRHRG